MQREANWVAIIGISLAITGICVAISFLIFLGGFSAGAKSAWEDALTQARQECEGLGLLKVKEKTYECHPQQLWNEE